MSLIQQNRFIINGLCRSGNHAITFWLLHNLADNIVEIDREVYRDNNHTILYMNNVGRRPKEYLNLPSIIPNSYKYIFQSYEDMYYNKYTTLIILRDFINMLCSRYKKYGPNLALNSSYICSINKLISVWKQHACANHKKIIFYNKWIIDKEYRDYVSSRINIPNIIDNYTYISSIGQGSSFDSYNKEYLRRYEQIKLPQYIIDHILMDISLIHINKNLFNIDLESILQK